MIRAVSMLEAALAYAERGFPVFPVNPHTKAPLLPREEGGRGHLDATINTAKIGGWWTRWPDAAIGNRPGELEVVIDVDPRAGGDENFGALTRRLGPLPPTVAAKTGGGGRHLRFLVPAGIRLPKQLAPGVELKGHDGYVILPPSLHPSGNAYVWAEYGHPAEQTVPELPETWLDAIHKAANGGRPGPAAPLPEEIHEGQGRNNALTSLAGSLRRRSATEAEILEALRAINASRCRPPLADQEVQRIAGSVARYAAADPRGTDENPSCGKGASRAEQSDDWSEPKDLPSVSDSVPSMTSEILPEPFAAWISDVANRLSVPVEYVALPAVSAVASVIGRAASIRPKRRDDWTVVPTLWGANIGGPGALKSPAIEQAIRPIKKLAKQARLDFEGRSRAAQGDIAEREARVADARKAIEAAVKNKSAPKDRELAAAMGIEWNDGALKPEDEEALRAGALEAAKRKLADLQKQPSAQPIQKRYVTNDATTEKLGELLNENPRGLLLVRDELTGWLFSLEKSGREGDRAFFLESWEGIGSFDVDRIGRGSIHVPALTLSVFGGIQPDRLRQFFSGAMANGGELDGLLQRFQLLAWPDDPGEWCLVDRWPDGDAAKRAFAIFERLDGMDAKAWGAKAENDEIPFLRFASDAQALYDEWLTKLMHRVRSKELEQTPGFAAHLAKYPSLHPKLALVFHLIAVADGREPGPITLEAARLAGAWCDFLEAHARKVYAPELKGNVTAAHALAKKILAGDVVDGMTVREVWRCEWSGLRTSAIVYSALDVLEGCGWTRVETVQTGGAPSPTVRINPRLRPRPAKRNGS